MRVRSLQDLRTIVDGFIWQDDDAAGYNQWQRAGMKALRIVYAIIRDMTEGQLSLRAMSLVYYTVIAIVPLLALTFSVIKGLGVHNSLEPFLLSTLEPFLGEYGAQITDNVVRFVDNVRVDVLSVVSLGVLLYTVLTMMQKVEFTFNYIWSVSQPRSLTNRVSEYLFAVIVSPLLILISVGIASYVNTNFFVRYLETVTIGEQFLRAMAVIMPFIFMSLAFALAFSFIPNTRVKFSSAFLGGMVTTIAWKAMGWVFQNFITVNSANAVIYAAFFAVILVMLFIYLGWLMLMIGSSVAFYHQNPSKARSGRKPLGLSQQTKEELTLTIAMLIIKRFQKNQPPWTLEELHAYTRLSPPMIEAALSLLISINFIRTTDEQPRSYLPVNSVQSVRINDIRHRLREYAPDGRDIRHRCQEQQAMHAFLGEFHKVSDEEFGQMTFAELLKETPSTAEGRTVKEDLEIDLHKDSP